MSTNPPGAPSPSAVVEILKMRFDVRAREIQGRGGQRDVIAGLAVTVLAGVLVTGWTFVLLASPLLFLYLAARWNQHDKRIASAAMYNRDVLEPKMKEIDGLEGYEAYLDRTEPSRSYDRKATVSHLVTRGFFPVLELATTIMGVGRYIHGQHNAWATVAVVVAALAGVYIAALSWVVVKHQRSRHEVPRKP